ncbi:Rho-type gtpase-activating protein, partial [Coemansia nantahalensis]
RIKVYRTISDSMPAPHGETLRFLMQHLQRISRNQQENKMTTNNLSVVFAPNILHMAKENMLLEMANMSEINKTVSFLIEHADEVWADAPKQVVESTATAVDSALGPAPVPSFQLPPMNRHTEMSPFNLGAIAAMSPMVLSSPNSPANHRGNREHAGNSGALEVPRSARRNSAADGAADGASSLSRSMPSPDHLPFGMPPAFLPRLNGRDSDAPPRASIDMSRLMK